MIATKSLKKNPREVIKTIANNHVVFSSIKDFPWPLHNRSVIGETTWVKQPDGSYVYAWKPPTNEGFNEYRLIDIGKNKQRQLVRGESRGFAIIQNLDDRSSRLTWLQQSDVKGKIPHQIVESQLARLLRPIFQVREKFSRDDEVDKMEREKLMTIMRSGYQEEVYDSDETSLIDSIRSIMNAVPNRVFRPLDNPDFRTKMSIAHFKGENDGYMKCEVIIDASLEEVAAYSYIYKSRERVKLNDRNDVLHRDATNINNHALDLVLLQDFGLG